MYVYFQMMKYHSSKMRVFLLVIKTVFPMFASKKNPHSKNCWHFTSKKISCTWKASKFFAQNLFQSLIHNCLEYLWKK